MLKTILFDLGNVLVHFSHDRMCDQIGHALGRTGADVRRFLIDSGLMWDFERGKLTEAQLLAAVESEITGPFDHATVNDACCDIFTLNEPIVPVVHSLKDQGLRLVLLSNTSPWHVAWVRKCWPVLEPFDELVLSYEVGAIKPEAPAYEAALRAIHCRPEECFYTDDIPKYVARGREFGLQAEVFTDVPTLRGHLADRGIRVVAQ
jgi:glucose-1-phosphatase